jgi:hypothetical protein
LNTVLSRRLGKYAPEDRQEEERKRNGKGEEAVYPKPEGTISHGRRILISLIEERKFSPTLRSWGVTEKSLINFAYEIALGRSDATFFVVFNMREHIRPELWYYDEAEEEPFPVKVKFVYPSTGKAAKRKFIVDETAALERIQGIMERREAGALCASHGIKYYDLWGCCSKRKKANGRYAFHTRPSYHVIRALRDTIHPALWYVFPDELI